MNIKWETKSPKLFNMIIGESQNYFINGGNLYDYQVYKVLSEYHTINPVKQKVKSFEGKILKYIFKSNFFKKTDYDLVISDPFTFFFNLKPNYSKQIVILHHIDIIAMKKNIYHRLFNRLLIKKLKKVRKVVTVSKFWYDYLLNKGIQPNKLHTIYNSYDIIKYKFSENEKNTFRKKYNISEDKLLVYIGTADPVKGVYDVYNALKDYDYTFVMTGNKNNAKDIDSLFLNLSNTEFRILLNVCDVVICMSKLPEGWNRIAHESLLSKTPVVGSGICGMEELLSNSGQLICKDLTLLNHDINKSLNNVLAIRGYEYIKKFDLSYFKKEWLKIIDLM
jgi:hypothetical protein